MPIEFRCLKCSKLLRTPDESAGKKAKCPECGTIADVPLASRDQTPQDPALDTNDATAAPQFGTRGAAADSVNPYAAPSPTPPAPKAVPGKLQPTVISLEKVFEKSWTIAKSQFGLCILCGLVFLAIMIPVSAVTGSIRAIGESQGEPLLIAIGVIIEQVVGFFVNTFFVLGMLIFGLNLMRTGNAEVSDLFGGGPFYLRGLGALFLVNLMTYGAGTLCLLPAIATIPTQEEELIVVAFLIFGTLAVIAGTYIWLRLCLAEVFIVDQNVGVFEALRLSDQFMTGNKFIVFIIGLLAGLVSVVVVVFTCCLGLLFVVPYLMALLNATIYLMATGQSCYDPMKTLT